MRIQCIAAFLMGCAGVVIGSAVYGKTHSGKDLTNFQRFLFATGFSYALTVVTEMIRFFADYLIPGSALQHYDMNPSSELLFFRVFGHGKAGDGQLPLLATDLRFFFMMLGTCLTGVVLLLLYERRSRVRKDENGLFRDLPSGRISPREHLRSVAQAFRTELRWWEYLLWWVLRVCMVIAICVKHGRNPSDFAVKLLCVNCALTFLIPLLRVVCVRKLFFGKLPLRLQSWLNVLFFTGSFLGHGCDVNARVGDFDKIQHLLTGAIAVFIGYLLIRSTRRGDRLSPGVCAAASGGFSCVVSIVWEVFEFFADYFMQDSMNQRWEFSLDEAPVFVRIFGPGAGNPGQTALLDTDLDILCHFIACVPAALILYAVLKTLLKRKTE